VSSAAEYGGIPVGNAPIAPVTVAPVVTPAGPAIVVPPAVAAGFSPKPAVTNPVVASKSVIPYQTALTPAEDMAFQHWVAMNKIPFDPSPAADYDMRGYWKAQQMGDPRAKQADNKHFPDTWKTPYHDTFSNESMYATPLAPHWEGDRLVDWRGNVLVDEGPPAAPPSHNDVYLQSPKGADR